MFAGDLWIFAKSRMYKGVSYPVRAVARLGEIPVGGVKLFEYPGPGINAWWRGQTKTNEDSYTPAEPWTDRHRRLWAPYCPAARRSGMVAFGNVGRISGRTSRPSHSRRGLFGTPFPGPRQSLPVRGAAGAPGEGERGRRTNNASEFMTEKSFAPLWCGYPRSGGPRGA
jgi:hypothetical protein